MIDLMLRSAASRSTRSIIGTGSRKPLLQRRAGLDEIAARVELFAYEMLRYLAVAGLGQLVPEEHAARLLVAGELVLEERSEEHTSELQSLMRNSYAVFCLKKKNTQTTS